MVRIVRSQQGWWAVRIEGGRASMGTTLQAAVREFRFQGKIGLIASTWHRGLGELPPCSCREPVVVDATTCIRCGYPARAP